jgi:hypothetical protein
VFRELKRSRLTQKLLRYRILRASAGNIIYNVIRMSLLFICVTVYILLIYDANPVIHNGP